MFGSHWEGDKDVLRGNTHLVCSGHQSQTALTEEMQSLRVKWCVALHEALSFVSEHRQVDSRAFTLRRGSRAAQTLQAGAFHSETTFSYLRGSHWPCLRQFEHYNEIVTVTDYTTYINNILKIVLGRKKCQLIDVEEMLEIEKSPFCNHYSNDSSKNHQWMLKD